MRTSAGILSAGVWLPVMVVGLVAVGPGLASGQDPVRSTAVAIPRETYEAMSRRISTLEAIVRRLEQSGGMRTASGGEPMGLMSLAATDPAEGAPDFQTEIVTIGHRSAVEVVQLVERIMMSPSVIQTGRIRAPIGMVPDKHLNTIWLFGTAENLSKATEIIKKLDQPEASFKTSSAAKAEPTEASSPEQPR